MLYILLPQQYHAEINELVKLFLPHNTYQYIDHAVEAAVPPMASDMAYTTGLPSASDTADATQNDLMRFNMQSSGNGNMLRCVMAEGSRILFDNEVSIEADKTDFHRELKMPLKILIYKALHRYTGRTLPWGALTGIRPVKIVNSLLEKGQSIQAITQRMQEYYLLSEEKTHLAIEVAQNEQKYLTVAPNSVSVYIGIPFCTSRCLYCSFPSVSIQQYGRCITDYLKALIKEVRWAADWMKANGITLDTIYIGGGTPTALPEQEFEILLREIVPELPLENVREYTVEAGRPDTISQNKLQTMKNAGVSRISINPQTIQDKTLRLIGRNHTAEQFIEAFYMAREEGFHNINCDLIAGLPEETLTDFQDTFEQISKLDPESLTVHTMSVKRASRLNEQKDLFTPAPDEVVSAMIDLAGISARKTGLRPYYLYRQKNILANLENVGYAKPGFEGIYNILIMEEIQTILALGAGAVSKVVFPGNRIERIFNVRNVEQYIQRIDEMLERKERMLVRHA